MLKLIFHDRTFKVGTDNTIEIESIINASMTFSQKVRLACFHIERAFAMSIKATPETPGGFAAVIQAAARRFLASRQIALNHPKHMVCPLSMDLFEDPVVAMDGVTYEHSEIRRFFEGKSDTRPFMGPFRREIPSKQLVSNLNLRSEVMEYRTANHLPLPTPQDPNVVAVVPLGARTYPQLEEDQRRNPDGMRLLHSYTFLDLIRKPGLLMILQRINARTMNGRMPTINDSKEFMITTILNNFQGARQDIVKLYDNNDFLKAVLARGLNLIQRSLGLYSDNGNNVHQIKRIYLNVPIQVTIPNTPVGAMTLTIKRCYSTQAVHMNSWKSILYII